LIEKKERNLKVEEEYKRGESEWKMKKRVNVDCWKRGRRKKGGKKEKKKNV
jgi:hypothetical protein